MAGIGLRPHTSKNSATEVGICPMACSPDFDRYIISHNKTPPHMLYHWKAQNIIYRLWKQESTPNW
eukprot:scaffold6395_cov224-Ochromonas_danica.AAC.1